MDRQTIFISDLHLSHNEPSTAQSFLKFLAELDSTTDALYILGDLFQFWIGDDDYSPFNQQIKNAIKAASIKLPIYLMPGNRDFLLGPTFAKESNCTLLTDPCVIDLYGKKTVLTHGDILCTKDARYIIFRTIIRLPYGIKIFLKLPLVVRCWLARKIQKYSALLKSTSNRETLEAEPKVVAQLLRQFSAEQIIHGHIHIASIEELVIDANQTKRISLAMWNSPQNSLLYHQQPQK